MQFVVFVLVLVVLGVATVAGDGNLTKGFQKIFWYIPVVAFGVMFTFLSSVHNSPDLLERLFFSLLVGLGLLVFSIAGVAGINMDKRTSQQTQNSAVQKHPLVDKKQTQDEILQSLASHVEFKLAFEAIAREFEEYMEYEAMSKPKQFSKTVSATMKKLNNLNRPDSNLNAVFMYTSYILFLSTISDKCFHWKDGEIVAVSLHDDIHISYQEFYSARNKYLTSVGLSTNPYRQDARENIAQKTVLSTGMESLASNNMTMTRPQRETDEDKYWDVRAPDLDWDDQKY